MRNFEVIIRISGSDRGTYNRHLGGDGPITYCVSPHLLARNGQVWYGIEGQCWETEPVRNLTYAEYFCYWLNENKTKEDSMSATWEDFDRWEAEWESSQDFADAQKTEEEWWASYE